MAPIPTTCQHHKIPGLATLCIAAAFFLAALATPSEARATMMRYADIDRLVEISDVIVHATVTDRHSVLDDERRPWTQTTLEVHRTFYGPTKEELVFHQWGADEGPRRGRIAGDPRLDPDQEVILFLRRDTARDGLSLAALSQSVFYVHKRDEGRLVRRDLSDLRLVVPGKRGSASVHHDEPAHEWSIFTSVLISLVEEREE